MRVRQGQRHRCGAAAAFAATVLLAADAGSAAPFEPASTQASSQDHAAHHPEGGAAATQPAGAAQQEQGGAGGMGEMMEGMRGAPPREVYPSLMGLPEMTPEAREAVGMLAHERMQSGTALMSQGLERLARSASGDDFAEMQAATALMREGLAQFDSGLAAHRALAEGRPPQEVAMQWFKTEMNLIAAPPADQHAGPFGWSWFHSWVMLILLLFTGAMIWMYFFKMRRAAALLARLTAGSDGAATQDGSAATVRRDAEAGAPTGNAPKPPASSKARWSGQLRVARIFEEAPNARTFRLTNPDGGSLPFTFQPGQFLTVKLTIGGTRVQRSYTISSSPARTDYCEITAKRALEGLVSGYLNQQVREGELLEITAPAGRFTFTGAESESIVLIAAGVGITPMMSVIRYLTDESWPGDIYLIYACQGYSCLIFREELNFLKGRHPNLHVTLIFSRETSPDWKGPRGYITKELIADAVPNLASRRIHVCGPPPMMEAVKAALAELGVPPEQIRTEAFTPERAAPVPPPGAVAETILAATPGVGVPAPAVSTATAACIFEKSEKRAPLPPEKSILEASEDVDVNIEYSCRVGTCGVCKTRLLAGEVTMAVEEALEPEEKAEGWILACQAKTSGGDVTVDA